MDQMIGNTIVILDETDSTNNYATGNHWGAFGNGTVVLAYKQTAGRGQRQNFWESEPFKNLTFSIVLKPGFLEIRQQFMLSKVVCLGISNWLLAHVPNVSVKWPNDIYVDNRKIGGILIENVVMNGQIQQSVVGIGLNINQEKFVSNAPNPVSLKMLTGKDYLVDAVLQEVLREIDLAYQLLVDGRHDTISQQFEQRLFRLRQWFPFRDEEHLFTGMIVGVNGIGQLMVREENGKLNEYHFKEVEYCF